MDMGGGYDFEHYEQDYLRRLRGEQMTEYERYKEGIRKKYADAKLAPHDTLVLAMIVGGHHFAQLGMGTARITKSMLRLHGHGMIRGRTKLSFDERELQRAFACSPVFQRYAYNLEEVSSKDDMLFFEVAAKIMCGGTESTGGQDVEPYVLGVTDAGRQLLEQGGGADHYDRECQRYTLDALRLYGGGGDGGSGSGLSSVAAGLVMGGLTGGMLGSFDA